VGLKDKYIEGYLIKVKKLDKKAVKRAIKKGVVQKGVVEKGDLEEAEAACAKFLKEQDLSKWPAWAVKWGLDQIDDVVRATLKFDHPDDLIQCFKDLNGKYSMKILKSKERYKEDEGSDQGYRDAKVILEKPDGTMVEIQFNGVDVLEAKDKCHPLYEIVRAETPTYSPPDEKKKKKFLKTLKELAAKFDKSSKGYEYKDKQIDEATEALFPEWKACMEACYNELNTTGSITREGSRLDTCTVIQQFLYQEGVHKFVSKSGKGGKQRFTFDKGKANPAEIMGFDLSILDGEQESVSDRAHKEYGFAPVKPEPEPFMDMLNAQIQDKLSGIGQLDKSKILSYAKEFFSVTVNCNKVFQSSKWESSTMTALQDSQKLWQQAVNEHRENIKKDVSGLPKESTWAKDNLSSMNAGLEAFAKEVINMKKHDSNKLGLELILWIVGGSMVTYDERGKKLTLKMEGGWEYADGGKIEASEDALKLDKPKSAPRSFISAVNAQVQRQFSSIGPLDKSKVLSYVEEFFSSKANCNEIFKSSKWVSSALKASKKSWDDEVKKMPERDVLPLTSKWAPNPDDLVEFAGEILSFKSHVGGELIKELVLWMVGGKIKIYNESDGDTLLEMESYWQYAKGGKIKARTGTPLVITQVDGGYRSMVPSV